MITPEYPDIETAETTDIIVKLSKLAYEQMDCVFALAGRVSYLIHFLSEHGVTGFESPLSAGGPPRAILSFRLIRQHALRLGPPEKLEKLEKGLCCYWPGFKTYLSHQEALENEPIVQMWERSLH